MKKIIYLMIGAMAMFAACNDNPFNDDVYDTGNPYMKLDKTEYLLESGSTAVIIDVNSNIWWNIDIIDSLNTDGFVKGYTVAGTGSKNGTKKVTFELDPNYDKEPRSATLSLSSQKLIQVKEDDEWVTKGLVDTVLFTIAQKESGPVVVLKSESFSEGKLLLGKYKSVCEIIALSNVEWTIEYNIDWITKIDVVKGNADVRNPQLIKISYERNESDNDIREGVIKFMNEGEALNTLNISQLFDFNTTNLTIEITDDEMLAEWDQVIGAESYTMEFRSPEDDALIGSGNFSQWITSLDLGAYFLEHPIGELVNVTIKANTSDPEGVSVSNEILLHPLFDPKSGNGTEGNEFLISCRRHLKNINARDVNNANNTMLNKYYRQTVNLDFKGKPVFPVGTPANRFTGSYNGNSFAISNINVTIDHTKTKYWGIFGVTGTRVVGGFLKGASISNLKLRNCWLTVTGPEGTVSSPEWPAPQGFGILVGFNQCGHIANIETNDCFVDVTNLFCANTGNDNGTLNPYLSGLIAGCNVGSSDVTALIENVTLRGGGIRGNKPDPTTTTSFTNGVPDKPYRMPERVYVVGGVTGGMPLHKTKSFALLKNCHNESAHIRTHGCSGGLVGYNNSLERCSNKATVNGFQRAGGILAWCKGGEETIKQCYNAGYLYVTGASTNIYAGGIVGWGNNSGILEIIECYNSGVFMNEAEMTRQCRVGGIIGGVDSNLATTIKNCFNTGNITCFQANNANSVSGGIVGFMNATSGTNVTIENCYSVGRVFNLQNSQLQAAGIAGSRPAGAARMANCYFLFKDEFGSNLTSGGVAIFGYTGTTSNVPIQGKTVAEMRSRETYATWQPDFDNVWHFASGDYLYPLLRALPYVPAQPRGVPLKPGEGTGGGESGGGEE